MVGQRTLTALMFVQLELPLPPNRRRWVQLPQPRVKAGLSLRERATSLRVKHLLFYIEGYRRGHNEVVLKTIRGNTHAGSNPAPSAISPITR